MASGVSKDYVERVLYGFDLEVAAGEIHALLGANGAGKSTVCGILAGLVRPTAGRLMVGGSLFVPTNKAQAERAGVQIVQQHLNLIGTLDVAENLLLSEIPSRFGWIDRPALVTRARELLARVGLEDLDPGTPVAQLGVGMQQLVEIAAALGKQCQLLILDEPTAALTDSEAEVLFAQVHDLKRQGVAVLYVSHRLDEVRALCDRWSVLRDGRLVANGAIHEVNNRRMVQLMVGEELTDPGPRAATYSAEVLFEARGMVRGDVVRGAGLTVHRGERVGIAGLVGSGRSEMLRVLYGADAAEAGEIRIKGQTRMPFRHPGEAVAGGVVMLTEDRKTDGLLLEQSVRVNASLAAVPTRYGFIDLARERERTSARLEELQARYRHLEQPAGELSGGNQQKLALARWLEVDADLFLLDEPTRGIDVAARQRIHHMLEELARRGKGVLIVSSDIDELIATCDTILAYAGGQVVARFDQRNWSRQIIVEAAFEHQGAARLDAEK